MAGRGFFFYLLLFSVFSLSLILRSGKIKVANVKMESVTGAEREIFPVPVMFVANMLEGC